MRKQLRLLWLLGLPLLCGAQILTGSISGTVRDSSGANVSGATVTLTSKAGESTMVSGSDGSYAFRALEPGTYEVGASLAGFQNARRTGLVISPSRVLAIDLVMRVNGDADRVADVAIDVKSSSTETTISETLLASVPIARNTVDLLNYAPAINNGSAYGGESGTANALLLDGVDTRDPASGAAGPSFTYQIIEGFHVQGLGAPATYGAFTGAIVHTITRSGARRLSGLVDLFSTYDGFGSNNVPADVGRINPALTASTKTTKAVDVSGHLGGPLLRDRLLFFASAQRAVLDTDPAGPVTGRHEATPRLSAKFTFNPSPTDTFTGQIQYASHGIKGDVPDGYPLAATDSLTSRGSGRDYVWRGQWRRAYSSSTFSEIRYAGWSGRVDTTPEVNKSGRFDEKGLHSVSQGTVTSADRGRQQVSASLSHYAQAFGRHDFKFGAEFERSRTRDRFGYVDDVLFYDYGGRPYLAYSYSYDVSGSSLRQSVFAQDGWSIGGRLTANVGVRGDVLRGKSDGVGTVYRSTDWAPRLGAAWDLTGGHRMVLKGSYGWYYENAQTGTFRRAVPGISDRVTYLVRPNSTLGPEVLRERVNLYGVASDIKQPRVDELSVGFERVVTGDMRLAVTGVWRETKNFVNSIAPLARWTPVTTNNALAGAPITLYRWINRAVSENTHVIQNVRGFEYKDPTGRVIGVADPRRTYKALIAVLTKRLSKRWEAQVSYVLAEATGTVDTTSGAQAATRQFETPNLALVNVDGSVTYDRTHEFKLLGSYQIPAIDVSIGAVAHGISGRPYTPYQRFPNLLLNTVGLPTEFRQPFLLPRGSRRTEAEAALDLRIEKSFRVRNEERLGIYVDVTNVANAATVTRVVTRYPSASVVTTRGPVNVPFATPDALVLPRQIWIGGRWSF